MLIEIIMKIFKIFRIRLVTFLIFSIFSLMPQGIILAQQKIGFGLHLDPVISWFSSDIKDVRNEGARPGFNFGLTYNRYFTPNYSFSAGISLLSAGGRLIRSDTTLMEFRNARYKHTTVLPGEAVVYKIQYLVFPVGLKLQTNQIGYITFFSDIGFGPKIVINGKADIASQNISGEKPVNELRMFNLSYYLTAGIEYSLGGTTALVFGLNFDNNFLDITRDIGNEPVDKVSNKILSFRIGVNF
jgi:hypothetical protein